MRLVFIESYDSRVTHSMSTILIKSQAISHMICWSKVKAFKAQLVHSSQRVTAVSVAWSSGIIATLPDGMLVHRRLLDSPAFCQVCQQFAGTHNKITPVRARTQSFWPGVQCFNLYAFQFSSRRQPSAVWLFVDKLKLFHFCLLLKYTKNIF